MAERDKKSDRFTFLCERLESREQMAVFRHFAKRVRRPKLFFVCLPREKSFRHKRTHSQQCLEIYLRSFFFLRLSCLLLEVVQYPSRFLSACSGERSLGEWIECSKAGEISAAENERARTNERMDERRNAPRSAVKIWVMLFFLSFFWKAWSSFDAMRSTLDQLSTFHRWSLLLSPTFSYVRYIKCTKRNMSSNNFSSRFPGKSIDNVQPGKKITTYRSVVYRERQSLFLKNCTVRHVCFRPLKLKACRDSYRLLWGQNRHFSKWRRLSIESIVSIERKKKKKSLFFSLLQRTLEKSDSKKRTMKKKEVCL